MTISTYTLAPSGLTHKTKGNNARAIHPVLVAIGGLPPYERSLVFGQ